MKIRLVSLSCLAAVLLPLLVVQTRAADGPVPLVIGETFTVDSTVLGEIRRINVYFPPVPCCPGGVAHASGRLSIGMRTFS